MLGEAHAVTRVHAQSTEGALFRLEHHDETVARVAKRRTFVPASTARARARARARDAAKPSMLIVLLVLRAWYRSALLSPYSRPYNSNDTYMHHRVRIVRILTLSNPVYVHTRCPPRSDARTRSRARSRVGVARPRTLDAARRHSPRRVDGRSLEDTGRGRRCASNAADALDRSREGARARTSSSAKRNNLTARASGLSARARGNGVERGERRGDARGGVVCRRCLALERERWEVKDEDER